MAKIDPRDLKSGASVRLNSRWQVGDPGAVYEFGVKIYGVNAPGMSEEDWEQEVTIAREEFIEKLRKRYPWIGDSYFTGRTAGWLAIEDPRGKANMRNLKVIAEAVEKARKQFKHDVEASAKTGYYVDLHREEET